MVLGDITGCTQELILALPSGITFGSSQGTVCGSRDQTNKPLKTSDLTSMLSLWLLPEDLREENLPAILRRLQFSALSFSCPLGHLPKELWLQRNCRSWGTLILNNCRIRQSQCPSTSPFRELQCLSLGYTLNGLREK